MFINLQYEHCQGRQIGSVTDPPENLASVVRYSNKDCNGPKYVAAVDGVGYHNPEFTVARDLYLADGDPWYASGKGCLEHTDTWIFVPDEDICLKSSKNSICPFERVPTWVQDLLPNPPYSMDIEYE